MLSVVVSPRSSVHTHPIAPDLFSAVTLKFEFAVRWSVCCVDGGAFSPTRWVTLETLLYPVPSI